MAERPEKLWRRASLLFPAAVLLSAIALQGLPLFHEAPRSRGPHLARYVPESLPGWRARDLPLGPNEFLAGTAARILNYDDYLYREFSRRGVSLGVYLAYWGPGKMPTRFVASHTPDRCWTENGWRCLQMKSRDTSTVEGGLLLPAEWRIFEAPGGGAPTYVLYWHLVDGELYAYGGRFNAIPDPVGWWADAVRQATRGSPEQYFIRLTSNVPFPTLWRDAGAREVLHGLRELGLAAKPPAGTP